MLNARARQNLKRQTIMLAVFLGVLLSTMWCLSSTAMVFAQAPSSNENAALEKVLKEMDTAAASFKAAQADFEWDTFTAVVNDHDLKTGTISYRKQNNGVEMAAQVRPAKGGSVDQYILYKDGKVQIYTPKTKQTQQYDAGKNNADVQSFLVLGFGGGGHEMLKSFDVRYVGTERVQGVDAVKLELTPKSERARGMFNKILLWIDPARGLSVQQQLFAPGGDYKLSKYSNIKLLPKLPDDVFKLKH